MTTATNATTVTAEGLSLHFDGPPTHTMKPSSTYNRANMQQTLGRICKTPAPASRFKLFKTSYGYLARIINGKLVRVARVSVAGIDYVHSK